ncbi:unnamed protein product [Paramecium octaurelia]|uniref:Uncharacterized protein n=1 Tax=Paramecium octaurelia TaxID=43137 RepID=A0A8S1SUV1_PAROT|nr:unnamed protein product [Paramecium octaurelia]
MLRFQKLGEDEQARLDQESLKQKKELLKQEFEHQEEIRKYDNLSIVSSNDFKFKAELDKLQSENKKKQQELELLLKAGQNKRKSKTGTSQMHASTSGYGVIHSINNHHSDPLFETFSGNVNLKLLDLEQRDQYIESLLLQESRYENLILEEQEKSESLQKILVEIEKSKLIQQRKCEELQIILSKADKRFNNTDAVKLMAENKKFLSKKNLQSIKNEFGQMKQMQDTYKHSQENKQQQLQKILYVGEENIGHNVLKMEEAERFIDAQNKEFEILEEKKQNQLKKKQESRYILTYIEFFEIFEQIFMNKEKPNEIRLVDQYTVNEEFLQKWNHNQQNDNLQQEQEMNFDRNELLSQINKFYQDNEQRTEYILEFMLEKYWHLQQELTKQSISYENLLKQKELLLDEIENLDYELEELKLKNPNLEIHEQSIVAEDAGLMNLKNETTTLNIKKMEIEEHPEQVVWIKATKTQGLLMNFQLGLAEYLHRIYQIIQAIDQKNKENKKFKYPSLNNEINGINLLISKIYNISKSQNQNNELTQQHLNQFAIHNIVIEVFPAFKEQEQHQISQYFYIQSKTDQILWFNLSVENLTNFLKSQENSSLQKLLSPDIINEFRDQLIEIFKYNFHKLFEYYQTMYKKIRDISSDLLQFLKEINPKFDIKKLTKLLLREGQDIQSAKDLIIRRMMEYKTGEIIPLNSKNDLNKIQNLRPKTEEEQIQSVSQQQQQQSDQSDPSLLFPKKERLDEDKLSQIQTFFRAKIREKNEQLRDQKHNDTISTKDRPGSNVEQLNSESISMIKGENKMNRAKSKKLVESKTARNLKDDLEQERSLLKAQIAADLLRLKEEQERKDKPLMKEQQNEIKVQIKQATERLYGERQYTVQIMRNMAQTTGILSDINQLEHFSSKIESPQLVGQFVIQRKNLHRNLNKELGLPTLSYLKPTSAYYSRRNQSSEQIKAMDYKRYNEIENGVSSRPYTQYQSSRKPQTTSNNNSSRKRTNQNQDELKNKYSGRTRVTNNNDSMNKFPVACEIFQYEQPKSLLVPIAS